MSLQTASPKTKVPMRLGTRVKGMQQSASIRSLSARESRKELVTVRRRRFRSSTATTSAFPQTLSTKISAYSRTRTVRSRSAGSRVTGCHAGTPLAPRRGRAAWPRRCPPAAHGYPGVSGQRGRARCGHWAPVGSSCVRRLGGEMGAGRPGSLRAAATAAAVGPGCAGCPRRCSPDTPPFGLRSSTGTPRAGPVPVLEPRCCPVLSVAGRALGRATGTWLPAATPGPLPSRRSGTPVPEPPRPHHAGTWPRPSTTGSRTTAGAGAASRCPRSPGRARWGSFSPSPGSPPPSRCPRAEPRVPPGLSPARTAGAAAVLGPGAGTGDGESGRGEAGRSRCGGTGRTAGAVGCSGAAGRDEPGSAGGHRAGGGHRHCPAVPVPAPAVRQTRRSAPGGTAGRCGAGGRGARGRTAGSLPSVPPSPVSPLGAGGPRRPLRRRSQAEPLPAEPVPVPVAEPEPFPGRHSSSCSDSLRRRGSMAPPSEPPRSHRGGTGGGTGRRHREKAPLRSAPEPPGE